MDVADITQERLDAQAAISLAAVRAAGPVLPDIGQCHNCGQPTPPAHRWCDADCRDDWQLRTGGRS